KRGGATVVDSLEAQSQSLNTRCLRFMPPSQTTMQNSLPVMASFSGWDSNVPTEFRWAVSALRLPPPLSLSWRDCRQSLSKHFVEVPLKMAYFDKVFRQRISTKTSATKPWGQTLTNLTNLPR